MGNCCPTEKPEYQEIKYSDEVNLSSQNKQQNDKVTINFDSVNRSINNSMTATSTQSMAAQQIEIPVSNNRSGQIPIGHSNGGQNGVSKSAFYLKYELRDEIGVGSTSKCYKCMRKSDGKFFACKVIDKRQVEMKFSGLLDQFFVVIKVIDD